MPLSQRLANALSALPKPKVGKPKKPVTWFVEFACSKDSSCSKAAQERGISYIGFSKDVCDLTDPNHIEQIMMWAHERLEFGESFHLWGSLPYTTWPSWQNLLSMDLPERFKQEFSEQKNESKIMVENFAALTDLAVESGGSSSCEWPRYCSGRDEIEALSTMIVKHNMFSSCPCGCSFSLEIKGKRPKKPWRVISTNQRLAVEMNNHDCRHPKGFKHDLLEGSDLVHLSGFYNHAMATSILCSIFPEKFFGRSAMFPIGSG